MNFKTEERSSRVSKLFIICMIISPIVSLYSFRGLSLATVLIVLSYLLHIIIVERRMIIYHSFGVILLAYIIINTLFRVLSQSEGNELSILLRSVQYFVLLFIPLTLNPSLFDYRKTKKIYIRVAFIASLFLIIQYLFVNIASVYISGIIQNPLFPPDESILEITSNTINTGRRLSGLFSEPAAHGVYIIGALVLALFDDELEHRLCVIIVLCLSILMCVSSTGILTMIFVVGLFLLYRLLDKKGYISTKLSYLIPLVLALFVLVRKSSFWNLFLFRMQEGVSGSNRTAAYSVVFSQNLMELLLGHGMNLDSLTNQVYYSGYPRYIFYFGLFGLFLWLCMIARCVKNAGRETKLLALALLFLNIGESTMLGFAGGLFLFLICMGKIDNAVDENKGMII